MTMLDDGAAAGPLHAVRARVPVPHRAAAFAVPCLARPGSGLAHLDEACQCFVGGPPPVFLVGFELALLDR